MYRSKPLLLFLLCLVTAGATNANDWQTKDNRLKGKTQQSRPSEPQDFFVTKKAKV